MNFISTRGLVGKCGLIDSLLMGLAEDGGLLLPEKTPKVDASQLQNWQNLSYQELMFEIISLYNDAEIPTQDLKDIIKRSYSRFRDPAITPLHQLDDKLYVLELFHGPTFAFKDLALQFMGELYEYVAKERNQIIHILGATSGDTGAAAIEGVRGKSGIRICILHPHQKVSKVQELQMTTVLDQNVLNLSVKGNFDDCQQIIKELFGNLVLKEKYHLRAVNSINFMRILAQSVYYFYAYLQIAKKQPGAKINFSVPTGNFGNVFSGLLAKKMGLPIHRIFLATNENNILEKFTREGIYERSNFVSTYSPSMDIQVASNFERYLYELCNENPQEVSVLMKQFQGQGYIKINQETMKKVKTDFEGYAAFGQECLSTIKETYDNNDYLLDPHTACGVAAAKSLSGQGEITVAFGTAHPAKFNESIALAHIEQKFPPQIQGLLSKQQNMIVVERDNTQILSQLELFYQ
jgi:threonine synthase